MITKGVRTMGSPAYDKGHTRRINLKFNNKTDADILQKLDESGNFQGYIKSLIRADIAKGASPESQGDNPMTIEQAREAEEEYNIILDIFREANNYDR